MSGHFIVLQLCAASLAAVVGVLSRGVPADDPIEIKPPLQAAPSPPATLTEALTQVNRSRASHGARWQSILDLASDPPVSDRWPALLASEAADPFASAQIVRTWTRLDPEACWAHVVALGERGRPDADLATAAIREWAAADPAAAIEAAGSLPVPAVTEARSRLRDDLRWVALRLALANDMEGAMPLVSRVLDAGSFGWGSDATSSDSWVPQDPAKACRLLAQLPETVFRNAVGQATRAWFNQDPLAAVEWIGEVPLGVQREAFDGIVDQLREDRDAETLQALALATNSMELRSEVARALFPLIYEGSPDLAYDWLAENFHGEQFRSVARTAMMNTISSDRTVAFSDHIPLVERLPPGPGRGGAASRLLGNWVRKDPTAAMAWAESLDATSKAAAYKDLADNWARDPSAAEWLKSAPDIPIARTLLNYVIGESDTATLEVLATDLPPDRAEQVRSAISSRAR
jgi:hypothetical protein